HAGVAGLGRLHGVHGEETDGVGEFATARHGALMEWLGEMARGPPAAVAKARIVPQQRRGRKPRGPGQQ
ncbi:MAG: hypothetical protein KDI78_13235, partial [Xanthomonadales bacterium]|nr:hypothetical protein [Xanthomonadales bacterium]